MPPRFPCTSSACRSIPLFARALSAGPSSTSPRPAPSKDHLVHSYGPEAFPRGYKVASTHGGIKKQRGALDLGVLASTSDRPCSAAACLTRNIFQAAPVTVTTELLHKGGGRARGFVVNSGNANAVTGKKGLEDAWAMSKTVSSHLSAIPTTSQREPPGTLVMSTGVIGQYLPMESITSALPSVTASLSDTPEAWLDLARAFMTTDTFPKLRTRSFILGDRLIRMAGIDKGAGMIAPNMGPPQPPHATLLGMIATDAAVDPAALQSALNYAVDRSFNSITVDGDMSTNDTILCLANGAALLASDGGRGDKAPEMMEITEKGDPEGFGRFKEELRTFAEELAQLVVRDGEGATKFITVRVKSAPTFDAANAVARSVASSSLVKTAMYGEDANWGRILCAVGYAHLPSGTIHPSKVSVSFIPSSASSVPTALRLLTNGEPDGKLDEARASAILAEEDLTVEIDLGDGEEEARVWTCDFSYEYVTINGSYRT